MAENTVRIKVVAEDRASGQLGKVKQEASGMGGAFKAAQANWLALTAGIAAAGGAIATIKSMVGAASDLEESTSKARVVFGQFFPEVEKFAKDAAQSMGQSTQATLEATATFGNLFTALEVLPGAATDMSMELVKLSADLASFNNIGTEEALVALRSGIVGEAEPLRRLGVSINAATVELKAMELGLAATKKEITDADKVTARYALILEQTTTAQGDFERTSGGLANQQRILAAEVMNLQADLGTLLLPTMIEFTGAMIDAVGVANDLGAALGRLGSVQLPDFLGGSVSGWLGKSLGIIGKGAVLGALGPVGAAEGLRRTANLIPGVDLPGFGNPFNNGGPDKELNAFDNFQGADLRVLDEFAQATARVADAAREVIPPLSEFDILTGVDMPAAMQTYGTRLKEAAEAAAATEEAERVLSDARSSEAERIRELQQRATWDAVRGSIQGALEAAEALKEAEDALTKSRQDQILALAGLLGGGGGGGGGGGANQRGFMHTYPDGTTAWVSIDGSASPSGGSSISFENFNATGGVFGGTSQGAPPFVIKVLIGDREFRDATVESITQARREGEDV